MTGDWPELPYAAWKDTAATLHLFTQIVGKICLATQPWLNHSWHITLHPSARGLVTPLLFVGGHAAQLEFDFVAHALRLRTSDGGERAVPLHPMSVADFYAAVMRALAELDVAVRINTMPSEIPDAVRFDEDRAHASYDSEFAGRFHRVLLRVSEVFSRFRTGYLGKSSPVHFFWGSFDLAVTRFSGRRAPLHPGGSPLLPDDVVREAYSHEVASAGFWPGGNGAEDAAFYAYAYPEPPGYASAPVHPAQAAYDSGLGEFVLPYAAVRTASDPSGALMAFLASTSAAAADLGKWDRAALECSLGEIGRPRRV